MEGLQTFIEPITLFFIQINLQDQRRITVHSTVERLEKQVTLLKKQIEAQEKEIEHLKQKTVFFQNIFDRIEEEVFIINRDFIVQDANRSFLDHYNLSKKNATGKKCYEIIHHKNTPCQCPVSITNKTKDKIRLIHHDREVDKDKLYFTVMYSLQAEEQMPECFLVISRDNTEYYNVIKRLKASERRFRAILDTATDAIISINSNHKIVLFNNAAQDIFGWSRKEIVGKDVDVLIPKKYGDHHKLIKTPLKTKKTGTRGKTISVTALRKTGEEFPADISISFYETDSKPNFTAIIRDMTEYKEMEKKLLQTERLAAVGQAVASVAHEIRNPLMIIGGFSKQIRNKVTEEKTIKKLDIMIEEVKRLEKLVCDLRDFTKKHKLLIRPASINAVIMDALEIIKSLYPTDKHIFETYFDQDIGETNCDPDKLKQVFMNIIINGIEAMKDGGKIIIRTMKKDNEVEVSIQDTGTGINEEDLMHIFEPFFTTRSNGSGLGLAISYRIVQAHKGEIRALSKPNEGTTFIIKLPAKQ